MGVLGDGPTTRRRPAWVGLVLAVLAPVSCAGRAAPQSSASADRPARWAASDLRGLPATAEVADVVVRGRVWVAIGSVPATSAASPPLDLVLWRSPDGLAWQEAYRTRAVGDASTTAHVVVTADGFAVAGGTCRNEVCQPIALVSKDGRRWAVAERPPTGLDSGGSANGWVSALAVTHDEYGRPGRELLAVGSATQPGGGSGEARPMVWRSEDGGRTWAGGGGPVHPLDRVKSLGRTFVAHGAEEGPDHLGHDVLWRSDDGGRRWDRLALPESVEASSMSVTGHPRRALLLVGRRSSGEPALWRSADLVHWREVGTLPAHEGSLLDTDGALVFALQRGYSQNDRLELWGAPPGAARMSRTYFLGPKEQPTVEAMVALGRRILVYAAVGRPGTRRFVRLAADDACAAAPCPGAAAVPPDVVAPTAYRADPVPVISGLQRVLVADDPAGFGRRWTDVTPDRLLGSAKESVEDAVFVDRDHGWLVVRNVDDLASWILRTTDGGRSWATTSYRGEFSLHAGTSLKLATVGPDRAWAIYIVPPAGGNPYVSRTTDGGRTWSGVTDDTREPTPVGYSMRFTDASHGFSADDFGFGSRGLFATADGGRTWVSRTVPLPAGVTHDQTSYGLPRFFGHRGVVAVGIVQPEQYRPAHTRVAFYRSDDAGGTWRFASMTDVPVATGVQAVVAGPDLWWAADGSGTGFSVTTDGGRSWTEHRSGGLAGLSLVAAAGPAAALAVGPYNSGGGFFLTDDGGATWNPYRPDSGPPTAQPRPCPNPGPDTVPVTATRRAVAQGDLDGDGRPDRLLSYTVPASGRGPVQWRMRAEFADGTVIDTTDDEWRSAERPVGTLDVDGDGRQEIFIVVDGPDVGRLGAVALTGCQLSQLFALGSGLYYDKAERPRGHPTSGVTCADVDGDQRPEIIATTLGPEAGRWSYTAYRLVAGYARTVAGAAGRDGSDPRPANIRFGPGLHCDGLSG